MNRLNVKIMKKSFCQEFGHAAGFFQRIPADPSPGLAPEEMTSIDIEACSFFRFWNNGQVRWRKYIDNF
jgi:hypothetical protein